DWGVAFGQAFNNVIDGVRELKSWFDGLSPSVQTLITMAVAIGAGFLVGIGPALQFVGFLTTQFGSLLNITSLLLSPIGLVVVGITGLAVAFGVAMARGEEFRNLVFSDFEKLSC